MNDIATYLDNVFAAFPPSAEAADLRANIQQSMEDGYQALLSQGHSEYEAFGRVISQFGSAEELRQALGLELLPAQGTTPVPPNLMDDYLVFRHTFGLAIAGGVALCILGVMAPAVLDSISEPLALALFFLFAAAGVGLFVYYGIQQSTWEKIEKEYKRAQKEAQRAQQPPQEAKKRRKKLAGTLSGLIMMGATIFFFASGALFGNWHPAWAVFPICGVACGFLEEILKLFMD